MVSTLFQKVYVTWLTIVYNSCSRGSEASNLHWHQHSHAPTHFVKNLKIILDKHRKLQNDSLRKNNLQHTKDDPTKKKSPFLMIFLGLLSPDNDSLKNMGSLSPATLRPPHVSTFGALSPCSSEVMAASPRGLFCLMILGSTPGLHTQEASRSTPTPHRSLGSWCISVLRLSRLLLLPMSRSPPSFWSFLLVLTSRFVWA